ncbi:MAG: DUF819 family protein [Bacteroidales bacterium]|nr:DUF819 family protein [Bacteroidales bacterium]
MAYAVGIIMAISGYMEVEHGVETLLVMQKWFMNITVPVAIPLMLFSCNFRLWAKSLPKTIYALVGGVISIFISVLCAYFLFRNNEITNFEDISALMIGIYTGGTMNFASIGSAISADSTTMTCLMTIEMLVTFPLLLFIVGGGYNFFRKMLPFQDEYNGEIVNEKKLRDIENYNYMLNRRIIPYTLIGLGLSILYVIIGALISLLLLGNLNELIVILTVTTLGIISSFSEKIRHLPKTFEMGMIFILCFSIVVASQFNFKILAETGLSLAFFVLVIMITSLVLHFIWCRITKVHGDLFTVAIVGFLCSPPFVPPVVGAMGNKKVLVSGLAVGLVGYAIGTYLGIGMSFLLKFL